MKKQFRKRMKNRVENFNSLKILALVLCFLNCLIITPVLAQETTISGIVTDSKNGQPIIGATIIEKNTNKGTITNIDGEFTIKAESSSTLVITYVGYTTFEIKVNGRKRLQIKLEEDTKILEEVVVVGFGTQKKVNLTGAVSTVTSKALEDRPVSNVVQALQGAVTGLNVSNTNGGRVDANPTISIRGLGTVGGDSKGDPLVLIDGMEGDIYTLNPQDIENISFLKDAASSAIYGSRAPFGVILITTKKGSAGKTRVSYDGNFRSNSPINIPQIVDSYTFARVFNAVEGGRTQLTFDDEWLQRIKDFQDGKIPMTEYNGNFYPTTTVVNPYDPQKKWKSGYDGANNNMNIFKEIYKSSSSSQEHNVTVSGGSDKVLYYISGNYMYDSGLMKLGGDHQDRIGFNGKIDAKINSIMSINYGSKFIRSRYDQPVSGGAWDNYILSKGWPMMPVYDPNGYVYSNGDKNRSIFLDLTQRGRRNNVNDNLYQQFGVTLEPVKNWKIYGNFNFRLIDNLKHEDYQQTFLHNADGDPILVRRDSHVFEDVNRKDYYNTNIYSEYSKSFKAGHNFKLMAGYQSELTKARFLNVSKTGILNPENPTINTSSGLNDNNELLPSNTEVKGGYYNFSSAGYFGRLNYDYKGRYLIEGNLRYDGTSRFRADKRWNWLPGASVGWNIAQESFWKDLQEYVGVFKLRGSIGSLGNQNTEKIYPTYPEIDLATGASQWLVGGVRQNTAMYGDLVSQILTWEKITTYDGGVDFSFLKNKLTASFDYFIRYTNNMVGPAVELPTVYGVPLNQMPRTNNTDLKTYGFELDIAWRDRLSNGLNYSARFTLSDDQTTILKYPNPSNTIGFKSEWNGRIKYDRFITGEQYGNIWGYTTVGMAKTQEEMDAHLATLPNGAQDAFLGGEETNTGWGAGDIMYKDLNGDGKIDAGASTLDDPGDRSVIGNITPRFKFGLDLSADWKGFDFRVFFQGVMKRDYFVDNYVFWGIGRSLWDNSTVLTQHMDYFRNDPNDPFGVNLDAYYPRLTTIGNTNAPTNGKNRQIQTRYLQNAAYIRLKNLTLGYTLPKQILKVVGVEKFRLYVAGENLWTGTKLAKMFDPETVDFGSLAYPLSKTYSAGVSITF